MLPPDFYKSFPVVLGLKVSDAIRLIKSVGFFARMYNPNKKNNLTLIFNPKRINISISRGVVTGFVFF